MRRASSNPTSLGVTILRAFAMISVAAARLDGLGGFCIRTESEAVARREVPADKLAAAAIKSLRFTGPIQVYFVPILSTDDPTASI
jgi:hypothetical protein